MNSFSFQTKRKYFNTSKIAKTYKLINLRSPNKLQLYHCFLISKLFLFLTILLLAIGLGACGKIPINDETTAAYGSYLAPEMKVLRTFLDKHMQTSTIGQSLVAFYYKSSPPIADYIHENETVRAAARWILTPIVFCMKYFYAIILVLASLMTIFIVFRNAPVSREL